MSVEAGGEGQRVIDELFVPIDLDSFARWARPRIPGFKGPLTAKQFSKGLSNPKYLITDEGTGDRYVVKRKPPGKLLIETAHQVDREFRVLDALGRHAPDVPIPKVYGLCEDDSVIGATFFVMEFCPGRVFQDRPTLTHLPPNERRECMMDFIRSMAKLHKADPVQIGLYGQKGYTKMGNGYPRQMATWLRSEQAYLAAMKRWNDPTAKDWEIQGHDQLIDWMNKNLVKDEIACMHGDLGLHNVIFHPTRPKLRAMLDWENCTIAHPLSDLATIIGSYYKPSFELPEGFPTTDELMKAYCAEVGRPYPIPGFNFCLTWNAVKLMIQLQGIWARSLDPQQRSPESQTDASKLLPGFRRWNALALEFSGLGPAYDDSKEIKVRL
ncbi:kinase-like domain-containing protein [Hyaloraphidium curvatum]|nr:kinase-like domain-containing protein [Hyaloraphidium curvatum]